MSVAAWIPQDSKVRVANVYRFDTDNNVIIMDDCGEDAVNLKTLMLSKPPSPALGSQIGAALGEFLGSLHKWGKSHKSILSFFDANVQARRLSALITYGRLVSTITGEDALPTLSDPPLDVSPKEIHKISEIAAERASEIAVSDETMTMGDFWTGNLLVDIDEVEGKLRKIIVVDWEMAKPGLAALDVGQFYAEMDTLSQFHPSCRESGSSLCRSFFDKYAKLYPVDSTLVQKAAIHVGKYAIRSNYIIIN
jgi:5-methylthioribose kinase